MRPVVFLIFMLLMTSGCTVLPVAETPAMAAPAASPRTAAHEAVIAAPQNPNYTPLVGKYLAAANRDLPKKYADFTVEKVALINRDLVTVFKYDSIMKGLFDASNDDSLFWREIEIICRNPMFLELEKTGFTFATLTIFKLRGSAPLSPVPKSSCRHRGYLN